MATCMWSRDFWMMLFWHMLMKAPFLSSRVRLMGTVSGNILPSSATTYLGTGRFAAICHMEFGIFAMLYTCVAYIQIYCICIIIIWLSLYMKLNCLIYHDIYIGMFMCVYIYLHNMSKCFRGSLGCLCQNLLATGASSPDSTRSLAASARATGHCWLLASGSSINNRVYKGAISCIFVQAITSRTAG